MIFKLVVTRRVDNLYREFKETRRVFAAVRKKYLFLYLFNSKQLIMETQTRDVILLDELTVKSINFLRNNQRTRPTFEKIYSNIKKFETKLPRDIFYKHFSTMLTRNLIRDKYSNPDKESYVINIQSEIFNEHPGDSFNSNSTSENSSSIIVTSPPTKQHHDEYRKQTRSELNISNHQTETVISNSHDFQTEKMSTDLYSMLTKQHASNGLKKDIPTLTHKQLINLS